MTWRGGSIRWLAPSRAVMVCAGIFLSVSAECQSDPAALTPRCLPTNQQAVLEGPSPTGNFDSKPEQRDVGIRAVGVVIQELRETSYPELVHVDLGPVAVQGTDHKVRTPRRPRSDPSWLRRRPEELSQLGLHSHSAKQTPRKAPQLFFSGGDCRYRDEAAGAT